MTAKFIKIPPSVLNRITDIHDDRNIYAHSNPIARAIFWQRLAVGYRLLCRGTAANVKVLDFGGGNGAFLPTLTQRYADVSVIDLDLNDARRVAAHYNLTENVRFHECDITRWNSTEKYDVVVAMDVLEHFSEKSTPRNFLDAHLKIGGFLLVSLPTENWIYQLGRLVLGKKKPIDHYHAARDLMRYYQDAGYRLLAHRYVPGFPMAALPLFSVGLLQKTA